MFDEDRERTAILEVSSALQDAWNIGDANRYASLFSMNADYVTFNGSHLRGPKAIEDLHRWLFDGPLAGSRIKGDNSESSDDDPDEGATIRFLGPAVAVAVFAGGGVALSGQSALESDRRSVQMMVFAKTDDQWRITAFQNTRVQEHA